MQNEKEKKMFNYYQRVTSSVERKLYYNIMENGGEGLPTHSELEDISSNLINNYTEDFLRLCPEDRAMTDEESEESRNRTRTSLLTLSGWTDLLPDEELVSFIAKETLGLIMYTQKIDEQDD